MSNEKKSSELTRAEKEKIVLDFEKTHTDWSGRKIAEKIGFSARLVQDILKKNGLNRPSSVPKTKPTKPSKPVDKASRAEGEGETKQASVASSEQAVAPKSTPKKPRNIVRKPKYDANGKPIINHITDGIARSAREIDVLGLNTWSFGARLSPTQLNNFRGAFDVPKEFIRLVTYSDGGIPLKDKFELSGKSSDQATYLFTTLIPFAPNVKSPCKSTIPEIQKQIEDIYPEYLPFGLVEKDSKNFYLAFNDKFEIILLSAETNSIKFVAKEFIDFCKMLHK